MATRADILKRRAVFELPRKLGILQYVEYEPLPKEWCTEDDCFYEGLLTAEDSRSGVCVRYRVWVHPRDKRRWETGERWRRRSEDAGGCIKQQVADALWELAEKYDIGVWYKRVEEKRGIHHETYVYCGVEINGVELDQPQCRTAEECVKQILEDYKRGVERLKKPPPSPPPDPAEELLKEWPELQAFGVEWVKKWAILRDRLEEITKVLRRYPWVVEVIKQRPMSILHPYIIEVYITKDGSEVCPSLNPPKAFCAQNGSVKETRSLSSAGRRRVRKG